MYNCYTSIERNNVFDPFERVTHPACCRSCIVSQTVLDTLTEAYTAAADVARGTPGETTSTVRAFASLVVDQLNAASSATSPEEANEYQARR